MEISTSAAVIGAASWSTAFAATSPSAGGRRIAARERGTTAGHFRLAREFIYLKDTGLRYTTATRPWRRCSARPREEIIGRTAADLYGEEYREGDRRGRPQVLAGESVQGSYVRTVRGATRVISTSKSRCTTTPPGRWRALRRVEGHHGGGPDPGADAPGPESRGDRPAGRGGAHDLNNMLSPIIGYGELLLGELSLGDTRRESVNQILRAGNRARDLVRQLLAFSRKQTLEFRPWTSTRRSRDSKSCCGAPCPRTSTSSSTWRRAFHGSTRTSARSSRSS